MFVKISLNISLPAYVTLILSEEVPVSRVISIPIPNKLGSMLMICFLCFWSILETPDPNVLLSKVDPQLSTANGVELGVIDGVGD